MPKFEIPTIELPPEVARPLYAGVGATDAVVGYLRDTVADLQKRLADVQQDVQSRFGEFEFEPKTLRDQVEARVAELQAEAADFVASNAVAVNAAYADLAQRGEVLIGRINRQQSTQATAAAAKTTKAKAKTTRTQATKSATKTTSTAKKAAKSTATKTTSTAKKSSSAPKSSAKATATAAKKTASSAARATTDAAAKVGD